MTCPLFLLPLIHPLLTQLWLCLVSDAKNVDKKCSIQLMSMSSLSTIENPTQATVPPGVICTSAAGFTRWTHGQCTRFARACTSGRTNEARDETETKPRESRVLQ